MKVVGHDGNDYGGGDDGDDDDGDGDDRTTHKMVRSSGGLKRLWNVAIGRAVARRWHGLDGK